MVCLCAVRDKNVIATLYLVHFDPRHISCVGGRIVHMTGVTTFV